MKRLLVGSVVLTAFIGGLALVLFLGALAGHLIFGWGPDKSMNLLFGFVVFMVASYMLGYAIEDMTASDSEGTP